MKEHFALDPEVVFLNHGSFGACPRAVLDEQSRWRARLERQPVRFFVRDLECLLDQARARLAAFLHADPDGLAFVPNATWGVNAVLSSLALQPGDELLTTDHAYNACKNVLARAAERAAARVVVAAVPFPISDPEWITRAVLGAITSRTRLLLVDHVTSPTGLVFPVESLVPAAQARGVDVLVDGAHAPGMLDLDVGALGAAYYTGNCHKWLCAPKGAGFLQVRADRRERIRPAITSHGANSPRTDRSRFHLEFDWTGTIDPTPWLTVPFCLDYLPSLAGSWSELRARNRALALEARAILCNRLSTPPPAPESMIGSLAALPLPDGNSSTAPSLYGDPLQDALLEKFSIEVPIVPWPAPPRRLIRISAQLYNTRNDYTRLADALAALLR